MSNHADSLFELLAKALKKKIDTIIDPVATVLKDCLCGFLRRVILDK